MGPYNRSLSVRNNTLSSFSGQNVLPWQQYELLKTSLRLALTGNNSKTSSVGDSSIFIILFWFTWETKGASTGYTVAMVTYMNAVSSLMAEHLRDTNVAVSRDL